MLVEPYLAIGDDALVPSGCVLTTPVPANSVVTMASAQTAGTMIRQAAESALANVARDFVPTWERMLSIGAKLERLGELWHQPQGVREAEIEAMEAELKPVKMGGVK